MSKTIAILNNKGGSGKTSVAVNLAGCLFALGYKVLLVDFDGQANATLSVKCPTKGGTICTAVVNKQPLTPYVLRKTDDGAKLSMIPSEPDVAVISEREIPLLAALIKTQSTCYDYIVIDTPPAMGAVTLTAASLSDYAIIVSEPEFLAYQGILSTYKRLEKLREVHGKAHPGAVLFNRADQRKSLHKMTMGALDEAGIPRLKTQIRTCVAIAEAPVLGQTILEYAPSSKGAKDFEALTAELLEVLKKI